MKKLLSLIAALAVVTVPIVALATGAGDQNPAAPVEETVDLAAAGDTANGPRIKVGRYGTVYKAELYAEAAFWEFRADATGAVLTMAGSPAALALGNTNATGNDLAESVTATGVTTSLTAGSGTILYAGTYECHATGRVTGEEDEDVTLEWAKNGTAIGEPAELVIEFDASTGVAELSQPVSMRFLDEFAVGDVVTLTALGSSAEVITFSRFNFGCKLIKSATF